jgi:hypothetical protein
MVPFHDNTGFGSMYTFIFVCFYKGNFRCTKFRLTENFLPVLYAYFFTTISFFFSSSSISFRNNQRKDLEKKKKFVYFFYLSQCLFGKINLVDLFFRLILVTSKTLPYARVFRFDYILSYTAV